MSGSVTDGVGIGELFCLRRESPARPSLRGDDDGGGGGDDKVLGAEAEIMMQAANSSSKFPEDTRLKIWACMCMYVHHTQ